MTDIDELLTPCTCPDRFTIEPHGDGEALYFGRCGHRHGYNLGQISEKSYNALDILNEPLKKMERLVDAVEQATHISKKF